MLPYESRPPSPCLETRRKGVKIITHRLVQALLTVSAICLIIGMGFTYLYALSEFSGANWVIIPHMIRFHGMANALGFALCGLLAWNILQPQPSMLDSSDLETRFFCR